MYIIIDYYINNTINFSANIIQNEYGSTLCFNDYNKAKEYAEQNCAWEYKIVKLQEV